MAGSRGRPNRGCSMASQILNSDCLSWDDDPSSGCRGRGERIIGAGGVRFRAMSFPMPFRRHCLLRDGPKYVCPAGPDEQVTDWASLYFVTGAMPQRKTELSTAAFRGVRAGKVDAGRDHVRTRRRALRYPLWVCLVRRA